MISSKWIDFAQQQAQKGKMLKPQMVEERDGVQLPSRRSDQPSGQGGLNFLDKRVFVNTIIGSFNLVSCDILCTFQQLHLGSLLRRSSPLVAALQAQNTPPINIIARHEELEILPCLTYSIPKYSLWIEKVVCHTCTVVFCR